MARQIEEFAIWRPNYGGETVNVYVAGTTTLANLWLDEAATQAASNPQVLLDYEVDDIHYGRFQAPVYVEGAYELDIVGLHRTGIQREPITSLDGEDASKAIASIPGVSHTKELEDWLAQEVWAEAYGDFGGSASDNSDLINTATGAAGGRVVKLPAGTIAITLLTLPEDVILEGQGEGVTILQSSVAGTVITLNNGSGLAGLTLDGINKVGGSRGIYGDQRERCSLRDVRVKRFETGIKWDGGVRHRYRDLIIEDCSKLMDLVSGNAFTDMIWLGGELTLAVLEGIRWETSDTENVARLNFLNLYAHDNAGDTLIARGGRSIIFSNPDFRDNTKHMIIQGWPSTLRAFYVEGGQFLNGEIDFIDDIPDIRFRGTHFTQHTWNLDVFVKQPLRLVDCEEASDTVVTGNGVWIRREPASRRGQARVVVSDATPVPIWTLTLQPGQVITAMAEIVGRSLDSQEIWGYVKGAIANKPASQLPYDNVVASFTVGQIVTGSNNGATGLIVADTGGDTLHLIKITGTFGNDETITDPLGGEAQVNGGLNNQALVLRSPTVTGRNIAVHTSGSTVEPFAFESDAAVAGEFIAASSTLELHVHSKAGIDVEWFADVWATVTED